MLSMVAEDSIVESEEKKFITFKIVFIESIIGKYLYMELLVLNHIL